MLLNKESLDPLNSLTYNNYGRVICPQSCALSRTNRLALGTEKCLYILNFNFEWPSKIKNSCPQKYLNKVLQDSINKRLPAASKANKPRAHIDNWLQELREYKNESLFINIIQYKLVSKVVQRLYKKFLFVEVGEDASGSKRKPFYKQMRMKALNVDNANYANNFMEHNQEQFAMHRATSDLGLLFDPIYAEYLTYLNMVYIHRDQEKPKVEEFQDGYKHVMNYSLIYTVVVVAHKFW
jgi:hypothetical protein